MTTIDSGITHRENGTPPPEVPLQRYRPGLTQFWSWDDDRRDGAFVTLRREAPDNVLRGSPHTRIRIGPRALGTDVVRPCAPCEPTPGSVQFDPDQRDVD